LLTAVFWALVQMLLLVLFGTIVMKLNWGHSPAALAVYPGLLGAGSLGHRRCAGCLCQDRKPGHRPEHHAGYGEGLAGRLLVSIGTVPAAVQTLVKVLPTRWAMQGMLDIVLRQQGLSAVLPEAAVLLGFAVLFYVIGIWRFRYE
jgi:ABC-2 type transport system permease protein